MKHEQTKEFVNEKLEFEENKILLFIKEFWRFSKFYGKYLGTMHSKPHNQPKPNKSKQD